MDETISNVYRRIKVRTQVWHFTAVMLPAEVQDLLCPSSFHTLIMKLLFRHPSGKQKHQKVCVGSLSCPIFLFSGNFISSSCSFKITAWNYCPFLCRAERPALNSQQKHGCGWDMPLNQAVVLFGSFLGGKGFCVWKIFSPTGRGCGYAFNSLILIFVCVLLNQTISCENKTCTSVILTM